MHLLTVLAHWLESMAHSMPLSVFITIGSLVEELIAPILLAPLFALAGSIAKEQGISMWGIVWLTTLGTISKTAASWLLYYIGSIAEHLIVTKWGKFFGITAKHVESFGKKFHRSHRDVIALTAIRLFPIFPSAPISIASGVIRLDSTVFLLATFLGNWPRGFVSLYVGYAGINLVHSLFHDFHTITDWITLASVIVLFSVFIWKYEKNKQKKQKRELTKNDEDQKDTTAA